ncbi:MAG: DUF503 domain-containing protein [Actinomycetota bacterium]
MSQLDLRIPASGSLKSKRHIVKGLTGGLRAKFNIAVAEVDHQDLWQRATLGVSCISESAFHAEKMLREIEKFVSRDDRVEILDAFRDIRPWED